MSPEEASADVYEITMNEVITHDNYIYGKSNRKTFASIAMWRQEKLYKFPRFANMIVFMTSRSL